MGAPPRALPIAWRGKKMNLVKNKRQNSNGCILGLPVRASLKGLLMKWLPEDERRKEHPRAKGPMRSCHLEQKEAQETSRPFLAGHDTEIV